MELTKISDNVWEIPRQGRMKVAARFYASAKLLHIAREDKSLEQARNVACLEGIVRMAYVMPDAHQGYGFPIGGVAAFDAETGIISREESATISTAGCGCSGQISGKGM